MLIKNLQDEDFVNYKKASMFIATSICNWKCCIEQNLDTGICQNAPLARSKTLDVANERIFQRYINNPITKAIVIGGLEPMLQFDEVFDLIKYFRTNNCLDDFVIYTGYYKNEIKDKIEKLKEFPNIVIKFGRYIPNHEKHYDEVLGIYLVSNNQYAERIS